MSRADLKRGRTNQKLRTRNALIEAAGRLADAGREVTVASVAQEARVSRATAYRYFPSPDALLLESELHRQVKRPEELFPAPGGDPAARAVRVLEHLQDLTAAREPAFRQLLRASMDRWLEAGDAGPPLRGARRLGLLEEALAPAGDRLDDASRERLVHALAMIVGQETFVAGRDVCGLDPTGIRAALDWAVRTLVAAALDDA